MWGKQDLRIKGQGQVLHLALMLYGTEQTDFLKLLLLEMKAIIIVPIFMGH